MAKHFFKLLGQFAGFACLCLVAVGFGMMCANNSQKPITDKERADSLQNELTIMVIERNMYYQSFLHCGTDYEHLKDSVKKHAIWIH